MAPLLLLLAAGGLTACADLLDVSDPTRILDSDVNDAAGAELLRRGALGTSFGATGQGAWFSGLFADEFLFQSAAFWDQFGITTAEESIDRRSDRRSIEGPQGFYQVPSYRSWQSVRRSAAVAGEKLKKYAPPEARPHVGEMFGLDGYAALRLAEDFCPGFPLHEVVDFKVVYGPPLSTEQAFERALAAFDSALTWAADSARILHFVRIGRGRTLLNLGRFAEAAAAVVGVQTADAYVAQYNSTFDPFQPNELSYAGFFGWGDEKSVADQEGGTGLDFVSAADPRVPTVSLGVARDGVTVLYGIGKYADIGTPIVLAGGIEARLIEAEAALQADPNDPQWLAILNDLRANQITPALPALADPSTADGRVDLLFRERAFWLFGTGHRLGDLRRLVRQYSRSAESVFPSGTYWRGGAYGTATSLPFGNDEVKFSPGITGCTG